MTTRVPTTKQAQAKLVRLLKTRGISACPLCAANGGPPIRTAAFQRRNKGMGPYAGHAAGHFDGAADDWLGWYNTAVIEEMTLLPDEWVTYTSADKVREKHPRLWRFVLENHRTISEAGIRCEYRSRLYRELGSTRHCVFIDTNFWTLLLDAGKGVKGAREYHALLSGIIAETKAAGERLPEPAPPAPEPAPPAPAPEPAQAGAPPGVAQMALF